MGMDTRKPMSKRVLTHQGLFLKYTGDIAKVMSILQKERMHVEVLDTEFAVLFEEAQKRRVIYEPYRDCLYAGRAVCRLTKNQTLAKIDQMPYWRALIDSSYWKIQLRMDVSGLIYSELVKQFGVEEGKRRYKNLSSEIKHSDRQIQGRYEFSMGIFFESQEDLVKAFELLNRIEPTLQGSILPSEVALSGFYLDNFMKERAVGAINLLELAQKAVRISIGWRRLLRKEIKSATLEEIHPIYKKNKKYLSKQWAIDAYNEEEEYEVLNESLLDSYSPSLRPDLHQPPVHSPKTKTNTYEVIEVEDKKLPIKEVKTPVKAPLFQFQLGFN